MRRNGKEQEHGSSRTNGTRTKERRNHEKKQGRAAEATGSEKKEPGATTPAMERQYKNGSAMLADVPAADGKPSADGCRAGKIITTGNKANTGLRRTYSGGILGRVSK